MKYIDRDLFNAIYKNARESPRKRSHYLLHNSHQDKVQRLLIGFVKGSFVEPHFHSKKHQWEMFLVIEGEFIVIKYDNNGCVLSNDLIGNSSGIYAIEVSPNEIHSVKCVSDEGMLLEVKEGPFILSDAKNIIEFK